jgi:hypothetical protein
MVALQADVARSIAKAIGTRVMPAELRPSLPIVVWIPEAYEDYLKGRFFFEKGEPRKASTEPWITFSKSFAKIRNLQRHSRPCEDLPDSWYT